MHVCWYMLVPAGARHERTGAACYTQAAMVLLACGIASSQPCDLRRILLHWTDRLALQHTAARMPGTAWRYWHAALCHTQQAMAQSALPAAAHLEP